MLSVAHIRLLPLLLYLSLAFSAEAAESLGKPEQMFNDAGACVWDAEYTIYGNIRKLRKGEAGDCPFRWPGQYADEETGLYYNRFRYYSPDEGVYLSQDPIGLAGNNPNLYAYVKDCNSWGDPFGLESVFTGTVHRGMLSNSNGTPVVYSGPTENGMNAAKSLGVRPGEAGMSTGIIPEELDAHRKPPEFGGTFKNGTMYSIHIKHLDEYGLRAIKDGDNHVSIITKEGIDPNELGDRLAQTQKHWKKVCP